MRALYRERWSQRGTLNVGHPEGGRLTLQPRWPMHRVENGAICGKSSHFRDLPPRLATSLTPPACSVNLSGRTAERLLPQPVRSVCIRFVDFEVDANAGALGHRARAS
jgi:hypothetical protein